MNANSVALDQNGLNGLRLRANTDPKAAVKEAARQFEALFMNELMKSMRATTLDSGLMDSGQGGEMATGMLDQQFAGQLTGMKGGLSEAIQRQLERQMGMSPGPIPATRGANAAPVPLGRAADAPARIPEQGAAGFVQQHTRAAEAAEASSGIPAAFMVAQAAHETGWGRKEIRHADGSPSFNLFGIKAGGNWQGPTAEITTTEYIGGVARKVTAKFRAYGSYAESFADYARLMKTSPRYEQVAKADTAGEFAQGLQKAGYATDPAYADKLTRVINTTLRLQRTQG
ncbi:MAG: flagellar assembly peptidoglycan hydrolase FlgJ [Rubrivivax sp.]|nr:flagellar assembly peptidoglycan hydrolase FlgJ [Rubrivivax sp.]